MRDLERGVRPRTPKRVCCPQGCSRPRPPSSAPPHTSRFGGPRCCATSTVCRSGKLAASFTSSGVVRPGPTNTPLSSSSPAARACAPQSQRASWLLQQGVCAVLRRAWTARDTGDLLAPGGTWYHRNICFRLGARVHKRKAAGLLVEQLVQLAAAHISALRRQHRC